MRLAAASAAAWLLCGAPTALAASTGPTSTPDDPAFRSHLQWGLAQAGFPDAWCRSTGAGALIVVIDTGVFEAQPDLAGKLAGEAAVHNGVLTTGPGSAADDSGHGTHVAGIAAASTDNGVGIAGAAPSARLFAIKVLWPSGGSQEQGSRSDLVQAIDYATDSIAPQWPGPVVLNVSIGAADAPGTAADSLSGAGGDVDAALSRAYSAGLGVALAAGNSGTTGIGSSAVSAGEALSVGALDRDGSVASYSPTSGVSIFAPGGSAGSDGRYTGTGILSTWLHSPAGDYAWMAGTSMAAPHVAAALALLMSTGLSNQEAYSRLLSTADAQRRLHVDAALGSTSLCGASAGSASQSVRATVVAPHTGHAAPAATTRPASSPTPSPSAVAVLPPAAAPTAPTAAPVVSGGHPWLIRLALLLCAVIAVWLAVPVLRRATASRG